MALFPAAQAFMPAVPVARTNADRLVRGEIALYNRNDDPVVKTEEPRVFTTKLGSTATSSRDVADFFGRKHKHVLRDIENLRTSVEATKSLFYSRTYQDRNNQARPEVIMNEEGFMLLAMGFTGVTAIELKLRFIAEFKRARKELAQRTAVVPSYQVISAVGQLAYYCRHDMQKHCTKQLNQFMMSNGGKGGTIHHHRSIMQLLMGQRPSQWRDELVSQGEKVKSFSGRDLLRKFAPAKAATAAVLDDVVRQGRSLSEIEKTDVLNTLPAAFSSLLALNLELTDLPTIQPNAGLLTA